MIISEINEEEMYCLVAPDGTLQVTTLAHELETCMGVIKLLHNSGMGKSLDVLLDTGFKIVKVEVTVKDGLNFPVLREELN